MNEIKDTQHFHIESVEGEAKLTILHGDAPKPFNPKKLFVAGNITAPARWLAIRKFDAQADHVQFTREQQKIEFHFNERVDEGGVITGMLLPFPELQDFCINREKVFSIRDLAKIIKFKRVYFNDPDENAKVVTALLNFKAQLFTDLEESSSDRGNSKKLREKKIESNVPVDFTLNIPLFIGELPKSFKVEVCFDTTDGGTDVWLESVQLAELLIKERDRIIDAEIAKFEGLVIIEQ